MYSKLIKHLPKNKLINLQLNKYSFSNVGKKYTSTIFQNQVDRKKAEFKKINIKFYSTEQEKDKKSENKDNQEKKEGEQATEESAEKKENQEKKEGEEGEKKEGEGEGENKEGEGEGEKKKEQKKKPKKKSVKEQMSEKYKEFMDLWDDRDDGLLPEEKIIQFFKLDVLANRAKEMVALKPKEVNEDESVIDREKIFAELKEKVEGVDKIFQEVIDDEKKLREEIGPGIHQFEEPPLMDNVDLTDQRYHQAILEYEKKNNLTWRTTLRLRLILEKLELDQMQSLFKRVSRKKPTTEVEFYKQALRSQMLHSIEKQYHTAQFYGFRMGMTEIEYVTRKERLDDLKEEMENLVNEYLDHKYKAKWETQDELEELSKKLKEQAKIDLIKNGTFLEDKNVPALIKRYLEKVQEIDQTIYGGKSNTFEADMYRKEALENWLIFNGYRMPESYQEDWDLKKLKFQAFTEVRKSFVEWLEVKAIQCKTQEEVEKAHEEWMQKAREIFAEKLSFEDKDTVNELLNFGDEKDKPAFSDLQIKPKQKSETTLIDLFATYVERQIQVNPLVGNMLAAAQRVLRDNLEKNLWKTYFKHEFLGMGLPATYTPFVESITKNYKPEYKKNYPNNYPHIKEKAELDDPNPYATPDTYSDDRNRSINPFYHLNDRQRYQNYLGLGNDSFWYYFQQLQDKELEPIIKRFAVIKPTSFWERYKASVQRHDLMFDYEETPRCLYETDWDYLAGNPFRFNAAEANKMYRKNLIQESFDDLFYEVFEAVDAKKKIEKKYEKHLEDVQSILDLGQDRYKETMQRSAFLRSVLLASSFQLSEKRIKQYQLRNKATSATSQFEESFYVGPLIKRKLQSNFERIMKITAPYRLPPEPDTGILFPPQLSEKHPILFKPEVIETVQAEVVTETSDRPNSSAPVRSSPQKADPPKYGRNPLLPINVPIVEEIKHQVRKDYDRKYEEDFEELMEQLYLHERNTELVKHFCGEYDYFYNYIIWYTAFRRDRPEDFGRMFSHSDAMLFDRRMVNILSKRKQLYDKERRAELLEKLRLEKHPESLLSPTKRARFLEAFEKEFTENELKLSLEELLQKRSPLWRATVLPLLRFVFRRPYLVAFLDNFINLTLVLPTRVSDVVLVPVFTVVFRTLRSFAQRIGNVAGGFAHLLENSTVVVAKRVWRVLEHFFVYSLYYAFPLQRKAVSIWTRRSYGVKSFFQGISTSYSNSNISSTFKDVMVILVYMLTLPFTYVTRRLYGLNRLQSKIHSYKMSSLSVLLFGFLLAYLFTLLDKHSASRSMGLTSEDFHSSSSTTFTQRAVTRIYDSSNYLVNKVLSLFERTNNFIFTTYFKKFLMDKSSLHSVVNLISKQYFGDDCRKIELAHTQLLFSPVSLCFERKVYNVLNANNEKIATIHLSVHSNVNSKDYPIPSLVSTAFTDNLVLISTGKDNNDVTGEKRQVFHSIMYLGVKDISNDTYDIVFNAFDPVTYSDK